MVFSEVLVLAVIPYYSSIKDFLNSETINYSPWSYVIYIGLSYLDSHVVSTKFAIDAALLLSYCTISNHYVTVSIIVTDFRCKIYFFAFLLMTQGPIRSTHILFHDIPSDILAGNLTFFLFDFFVR